MTDLTYDVRIWTTQTRVGKRGAIYKARWSVDGREHTKTHQTKKLAESFRSKLMTAARDGEPFNPKTGLPARMDHKESGPSWYEHAMAFMDSMWMHSSATHRKSTADGLVTLTCAIVTEGKAFRDSDALRDALREWSFNTAARRASPIPPAHHTLAVEWIATNSMPLAMLSDSTCLRQTLTAIGVRLDGKPAAAATANRKRAALSGALRYAVELNLLPVNPLHRMPVRRKMVTESIDMRTVINHDQARALLSAVNQHTPALHAYFACMYYAALRPAEVSNVRERDLHLPESGWGQITVDSSYQVAGAAWTDSGAAGEERELKHRTRGETRPVPASPQLVAALREHLDKFGTGAEGRLFVTRTGKIGRPVAQPFVRPVSSGTTGRVWDIARKAALTEDQYASLLAKRPYDLRHACVSTWLAAGVAPTQVARWAGHSVSILLRVYAHCVDGQETTAMRQIETALTGLQLPAYKYPTDIRRSTAEHPATTE